MRRTAFGIATVLLLTLTLALFCGCSNNKVLKNDTSYLQAIDRSIVDANDNVILLRGINLGGWLVQEGWMGMTQMDGGNTEVTQTSLLSTLNKRFGEEKTQTLLNAYLDNWLTDADFDNIKEMGFNCVRLPFTYLDILDSDYKVKDDAFDRIDYVIEQCKQRSLYVILDCHGAIGSQNGQHHSGDNTQSQLFSNAQYQQITLDMWVEIATKYKDEPIVAGYDLLNEPQGGLREGNTNKVQWDYYDLLIKAIRKVDSKHMIFVESCWEQKDLPNPTKYGWSNVVYEYHYYNWLKPNSQFVNFLFINSKVLMDKFSNYNVPVLIGEFTFFDNAKCWEYGLNVFDRQKWSYTVWTYKVNSSGNWGLYKADLYKADVTTDSYEKILAVYSGCRTDGGAFTQTDTYTAVKSHLSQK